jgi:hypothetical protein
MYYKNRTDQNTSNTGQELTKKMLIHAISVPLTSERQNMISDEKDL